jgi:hypothetical protein
VEIKMELFVVGKITKYPAWSFQGVFDTRKIAEANCKDVKYFVGPCILNHELPETDVIWPGAYYPKVK